MKSGLDHARILLEKAGNDLKLAEIGLEHDGPADTIAFHLQQAAEKILKASLASRSIIYPKTHDLDELFDLLPSEFAGVLSFRDKVIGWTSYAVDMRYDMTGYPDAAARSGSSTSSVVDMRYDMTGYPDTEEMPCKPPKISALPSWP
jgi:HEPN domain-containing protein